MGKGGGIRNVDALVQCINSNLPSVERNLVLSAPFYAQVENLLIVL